MSASEAIDGMDEAAPPKKGRGPLLIGVLLMFLLGGGGFYAAYSGLLPFGGGGGEAAHAKPRPAPAPGDLPAFVNLGEMIVPLGPDATAEFLVIEIELEIRPEDAPALEALKPRVLDVFNTFLRALDERDIEAPSAAIRLRAQLLRRARAVTAPVEPADLLITSFVLK